MRLQSLTFDALAPVIMVHGINADETWFNNFSTPFSNAKIPFKAIHFNAKQWISHGGALVSTQIFTAANQFGAKHVHIVAHSKGGLWTREFLYQYLKDSTGQDQLGVFSVHTLDTPHHGSVEADAAVMVHRGATVNFLFDNSLSPAVSALAYKIAALYYDKSDDDLGPLAVYSYNKKNQKQLPSTTTIAGRANKVNYFAYTGDANLGGQVDPLGFGIIDCGRDPCAGYSYLNVGVLPQLLYKLSQHWLVVDYEPPGSDGPITSIQPFTNSQPYPGNDYVVTVPSAMYTEDQFQTVTPTLFVNHSTISSQQIGSMIMNKIIAGLQTRQ